MEDQNKIKEDLTNILEDVAKTLELSAYDVIADTKMNFGDGFVSQFYTGQIKTNEKVINVAIKKAPNYNAFDFKPIFKNEEKFYKVIFPAMNNIQKDLNLTLFDNIPKYYCSKIEPDTYIAMEDLKPLGYKLHDKMQCLNKEHLEFIFETYGEFHALSFILKSKDTEKFSQFAVELPDIILQICDRILNDIEVPIKAIINSLEGEAYDKVKIILDNLRDEFLKACEYKGTYNCIAHGDCWSNNMLFKYSDSGKLEDMKLLDFQLVRNSTPIHDLAYFFYSGASKKDFDEVEKYLDLYHGHFAKICKELGYNADELFPLEALKREWRDHAKLGVFMGLFLWNIKLLPKERFRELFTNKSLSEEERKAMWEEMRTDIHSSDIYQEKIRAIIMHAIEYGIFK